MVDVIKFNNENYAVISSLTYDGRQFYLISKIIDDCHDVSNELDIVVKNDYSYSFIDDEYEYNLVKEVFEKKLDNVA